MKLKQVLYQMVSLFLWLCAMQTTATGQAVSTKINTNNILIGEQITYEVKINLANSGYRVDFGVPDSIAHFDIIEQKQFDTTDGQGAYSLRQHIVFTSFDSGVWRIPSFPVTVSFPGKAVQRFSTDSFLVKVDYSPADSTGQLRDIKPVMEVFVIDRTWIYIAVGVVLGLLLIYLLYRYFKKRRKKTPSVFKSAETPYEEAIRAINNLQPASEAQELKNVHLALSDVFKKYYSRKSNLNLMAETTGELLTKMQADIGHAETISVIAEVLRSADAVKFARYMPALAEQQNTFTKMKAGIEQFEKRYRSQILSK